MPDDDDERSMTDPHEHAEGAGAPGASSPGEQGYDGEATLNTQGGEASPLSFGDQFGRDDTGGEGA